MLRELQKFSPGSLVTRKAINEGGLEILYCHVLLWLQESLRYEEENKSWDMVMDYAYHYLKEKKQGGEQV